MNATFLAIVERGSQTAAAKHLHRSLQSIGRSLTTLERSVGIELVRRNTRKSHPTEAGLALYHRLKPALLEIVDAKREVANKRAEPFGVLRIAAPIRFASAFVVPVICEFVQRYAQKSSFRTSRGRSSRSSRYLHQPKCLLPRRACSSTCSQHG